MAYPLTTPNIPSSTSGLRIRPMSTQEEIEQLDALCERLTGTSDDGISLEWLDGYMTALAASPRRIALPDWLAQLRTSLGDEVPLSDEDEAALVDGLDKRWSVLLAQLDPEALMKDEEGLRLQPLILEMDEETRKKLVEDGEIKPEELAQLEADGLVWANGFMEGVDAAAWPEPEAMDEDAEIFDEMLLRVVVLTMTGEDLATTTQELYETTELTREDLIDGALFAVQDLRLFWLSHAPKPPTLVGGQEQGRNEPCACGSGKKFKKCHGA